MGVSLVAYRGQVLRLVGIVDRFGTYDSFRYPGPDHRRQRVEHRIVRTLCVRNLKLAESREDVTPDHWWFPLRQEWEELALQPGDRVMFSAKIHRRHKGYQPTKPGRPADPNHPPRLDHGPSPNVRNVVVLARNRSHLRYTLPQPGVVQSEASGLAHLAKPHSEAPIKDQSHYIEQLSQRDHHIRTLTAELTALRAEQQQIQGYQRDLEQKDWQLRTLSQELMTLQTEHQLRLQSLDQIRQDVVQQLSQAQDDQQHLIQTVG
ncbi:MAG: hypothetical protein IGQ88_03355, partial [Gloeomargaritaceae cyanobacterium C42_A2020_066]|nr:hypothetical protein [Gloeomargaritaceae cyanobacterium C42_A2020_066]